MKVNDFCPEDSGRWFFRNVNTPLQYYTAPYLRRTYRILKTVPAYSSETFVPNRIYRVVSNNTMKMTVVHQKWNQVMCPDPSYLSTRLHGVTYQNSDSSCFKMLSVGCSSKKFVLAYQNAWPYTLYDHEQGWFFYLEIAGKISPRNIEPTYQNTQCYISG